MARSDPLGSSRPSRPSDAAHLVGRVGGKLLLHNAFWLTALLAVLVVIFTAAAPGHFLTTFNVRTIAVNASVLIVLTVGEAFVIMAAGIDLSVGGVLVFVTVIIAKVLETTGGTASSSVETLGACVVGLIAGSGWGLLNGVITVKVKVPALIVTLASAGASLGLAQVLTNGNDISNVPNGFGSTFGNGDAIGGIPWLVVVAGLVAVAAGVTLNVLRFGQHTLAVGSSPAAASRAGIRVSRHLGILYLMSGLCAGVAAVMSLARFSSTTIAGHSSDALSAIAAVVLGGTSLFGGRGSIFGAVVGALIPAVLADGFVIIGFPTFWQPVVVGVILVLAVALDRKRRATIDD